MTDNDGEQRDDLNVLDADLLSHPHDTSGFDLQLDLDDSPPPTRRLSQESRPETGFHISNIPLPLHENPTVLSKSNQLADDTSSTTSRNQFSAYGSTEYGSNIPLHVRYVATDTSLLTTDNTHAPDQFLEYGSTEYGSDIPLHVRYVATDTRLLTTDDTQAPDGVSSVPHQDSNNQEPMNDNDGQDMQEPNHMQECLCSLLPVLFSCLFLLVICYILDQRLRPKFIEYNYNRFLEDYQISHESQVKTYMSILSYLNSHSVVTNDLYEKLIVNYKRLLGEVVVGAIPDEPSTLWASSREQSQIMCLLAWTYNQLYIMRPHSASNNSYYLNARKFYTKSFELLNGEHHMADPLCIIKHADFYFQTGDYNQALKFYQLAKQTENSDQAIFLLEQRLWKVKLVMGDVEGGLRHIKDLHKNWEKWKKSHDSSIFNASKALLRTYATIGHNKYEENQQERELFQTVLIDGDPSLEPDSISLQKQKVIHQAAYTINIIRHTNIPSHAILEKKAQTLGNLAYCLGNYTACIHHYKRDYDSIRLRTMEELKLAKYLLNQLELCEFQLAGHSTLEHQHYERATYYIQLAEALQFRLDPEHYCIISEQYRLRMRCLKSRIFSDFQSQNHSVIPNKLIYLAMEPIHLRKYEFEDVIGTTLDLQLNFLDTLLKFEHYKAASGIIYRILDMDHFHVCSLLYETWIKTLEQTLSANKCDEAEIIGERLVYRLTTLNYSIYYSLKFQITLRLENIPRKCNNCLKQQLLLQEQAMLDFLRCYTYYVDEDDPSLLQKRLFYLHTRLVDINFQLDEKEKMDNHLNVILNEMTKSNDLKAQEMFMLTTLFHLFKNKGVLYRAFEIQWLDQVDGSLVPLFSTACIDCEWLTVCCLMLLHSCPNYNRLERIFYQINRKTLSRCCPHHVEGTVCRMIRLKAPVFDVIWKNWEKSFHKN